MPAPPVAGALAQADADEYQRVKSLFDELADLPDEAARQARLSELQPDAAVAARVLALLAAEAEATRLRAPVQAALAGVLAEGLDSAPELTVGSRLGAWTLVSELGAGGMGRVFLAERSDGHYQQQAAVKLLRGLPGAAALMLLARERQILASLNHPHIARLIDGGTTPLGRPYLVMEHVQGERIDRWCTTRQAPLDLRLRLLAQLCDALTHAHRQLVVHCDIKPSNVLVAEVDGPGGSVPRAVLMDFGIAQLGGQDGGPPRPTGSDDGTANSLPGGLTPRYASPEQHAGAPATVASDVYGLGRLMETLLEPLPARAAEWRAIVARATAAAPGERYASVDAFAADIERLRRHEPLDARPALQAYRLRKFLRRRWPVVAVGAGVLALSAVFTASLVHERDSARREAERTRQVSDFVVGLFEGANPNVGGRVDLPVATLVDRGRDRLDANLADQPDLQSAIKGVLGRVYDKVGRPKDSVTQYRQALAAARRRTPRDPLEEATLLSAMSVVLTNEVAIKAGLEAARESLALRRTHAAPDSLAVADALNSLGLALSADRQLEAARLALLETLSIRSQQLGPEHNDVASVLHNLGLLAVRDERVADAESLFARALVIKQRTLPPTNGSYMNTERELAKLRIVTARNDEAIASLASLAERARAMAGPDSEMLGANLHEWGFALLEAGRTADAITVLAEALAVRKRAGAGPTRQALTINMLAGAQEQLGDPRAEASYRESLALRRQAAAPGQPSASVARGEENYARWLMRQGRSAEALPLLVSAQAARVRLHPGGHGDRRQSELLLAEARLARGDVAGARALWAPYASAALPPAAIARVLRLEAILLAAEGHPAESRARWDAALAQAQRGMDARGLPANHPDRLRWAQEHAAGTAAVSSRSSNPTRTGR